MDIIKKTINLEQFISRVPALVPYIPIEGFGKKEPTLAANVNGDYGGVMCDLKQNKQSTADLFDRYYRIKNILRGGHKYRIITKGEDDVYYVDKIGKYVRSSEFVAKRQSDFSVTEKGLLKQYREDDDGVYARETYIRLLSDEDYDMYKKLGGMATISKVEDLIGTVRVPSDIEGSKVPDFFYLSQIEPWIAWFREHQGYKYTPISKSVYDGADEAKKGEFTGELPSIVLSEHPGYVRLTKLINGDNGAIETVYKYYRKIDSDPQDCCVLEEWNNRGGRKMQSFLRTKIGIYSQSLETWRQRIENGDVLVPYMSIPILLTQNYDENGTMSVYDESVSYIGNEAGNGEPYTEGVGAESKLQTLRTQERLFDDSGNVLPYIGNGSIPYKINECKNVSFDTKRNTYIGDYIRDIRYYDEEDNSSSTITNGFIEFEYVIGGPYNPNGSTRIKLDKSTITTDYKEKTINDLSLTSDSSWTVISNSGNNWLTVSPESGSGNASISFGVSENAKTEQRVATVVFATRDRSNYEEVFFSVIQLPNVTPIEASFNGSGPNVLEYGAYEGCTAGTGNSVVISPNLVAVVKVKCTGSDWYVKSKPPFITLSQDGGEVNVTERVNVFCDPQDSVDAPIRSGEIVFAATNDSMVTFVIKVRQLADEQSTSGSLYLSPSTKSNLINYGESLTRSVYYDEGFTRAYLSDNYNVVVTNGNASLAVVEKNGNVFTLTNKNNTGRSELLSIKVYNTEVEDLSVFDGFTVTLEPEYEETVVNIRLITTASTVGYYKTVTYGIDISGSGAMYNKFGWSPVVDGAESTDIVLTKGNNQFSIKNIQSGDEPKEVEVYAKYDYGVDVPIETEKSNLVLKYQRSFVARGGLYVHSSYNAYVVFEVWPRCADPATAMKIEGGKIYDSQESPETPVWTPGTIKEDIDNVYCIRLTNPSYGYVPITHVTILNELGKVCWQYGMQYDQIYEIENGSRFTFGASNENVTPEFVMEIYVEP